MKKYLSLVLAAAMALSLAACGGSGSADNAGANANSTPVQVGADGADAATGTDAKATDIAMVTDVGNIDDQSFNQFTWVGVQEYCAENGLNANYYRPTEDSDAARIEQIDNAVADGAKIVVLPGYLVAAAVAECQTKYPDVQFIAIDVSLENIPEPSANTALITYKEEQVGYLAGYAAVADGYKELGFLGGIDVPAVVRYGYGFLQGADAAAAAMGVNDVNVKYWYSQSFTPTDEIQTKMDGWYMEGTEVVFSCGGSIVNSCLPAADANDGKVIGVDVDQSGLSPRIITSAMKDLTGSVKTVLADTVANDWKLSETYSGKETKLGAAEDAVGLAMGSSQFVNFTSHVYDEMLEALASGELTVDDTSDSSVHLEFSNINVDYQ